MTNIVDSIRAEYLRYKGLAEGAIDQLGDDVQPHGVHQALHRSVAHTSYHVGQIVYVAKGMRGKDLKYLSIAPGKSDAYTQTLSATGQNR